MDGRLRGDGFAGCSQTDQATHIHGVGLTDQITSSFHIGQRTTNHCTNEGTLIDGVAVELNHCHRILNGCAFRHTEHSGVVIHQNTMYTSNNMAIAFKSTFECRCGITNRHPNTSLHINIGSDFDGNIFKRVRISAIQTIDITDEPCQLFWSVDVIEMVCKVIWIIIFNLIAFILRIPILLCHPSTNPIQVGDIFVLFQLIHTTIIEDHRIRAHIRTFKPINFVCRLNLHHFGVAINIAVQGLGDTNLCIRTQFTIIVAGVRGTDLDHIVLTDQVNVVCCSSFRVVNQLNRVRNNHRTCHIDSTAIAARHIVLDGSVLIHHQRTTVVDCQSTAVGRAIVILQHGAIGQGKRTALCNSNHR